jgi:hypothetical protein
MWALDVGFSPNWTQLLVLQDSVVLDSDEALDAFTIVVLAVVLTLLLVAVALSCPQPRRVVR